MERDAWHWLSAGVLLDHEQTGSDPIAHCVPGRAARFPELTSAAITGPETVGDRLRYSFERAIGSKGYRIPHSRTDAGMRMPTLTSMRPDRH